MKKYIKNTLGVTLLLISINSHSNTWQINNVIVPDLQDCIEALTNGFIYEQNIYDNFNVYEALYDEYNYNITLFKTLPYSRLRCHAFSYEKYKPSK